MTTKTYIISNDEYMGSPPYMEEFVGTYRQLLEYVNGVDDTNRNDPFTMDGNEQELTVDQLSDKQLEETFKDANGDGQQYKLIWDIEGHRQVLGEEP